MTQPLQAPATPTPQPRQAVPNNQQQNKPFSLRLLFSKFFITATQKVTNTGFLFILSTATSLITKTVSGI